MEISKRSERMPKMEWKELKEYFSLLGLNLLVKGKNFKEYLRVIYRYYRSWPFAKADLSLILMYFFDNPFSINRRFFTHRTNSQEYTYGETPLTSLDSIAKEARITPQDVVYELGSGRGRTCFWLNHFMRCKVVGIELIPAFIQRAKRIQRKLKIKGVEFKESDFMKADLHAATVVYLYGTCLEDTTIKKLISHFKSLKKGTRIITVSYPLSDYAEPDQFEIMKRFAVPFTWGEADVYVQIKK